MGGVKIVCQKEKWQQSFIENGILVANNYKDERFRELELFEKSGFGKLFEKQG